MSGNTKTGPTSPRSLRSVSRLALGVAVAAMLAGPVTLRPAQAQPARTGLVRLSGHIPALVAQSTPVGHFTSAQPLMVAFSLPLRNQGYLEELKAQLYDPSSPLYKQFLTPQQFTALFGPTQADYNAVIAYAQSQGFSIVATDPGRTLLTVQAAPAQAEAVFGVRLQQYAAPNGRVFHAPLSEPVLPAAIAAKVQGIIGLDNALKLEPNSHVIRRHVAPKRFNAVGASGLADGSALAPVQGSGYGGGLIASDIRTAYALNGSTAATTLNGTGQTLGLFELDNYLGKDVQHYELDNNLRRVPLVNVNVLPTDPDFPTVRGAGTTEVILDIDLQIALAPGATAERVYIAPNDGAGIVAAYQQIATDNVAKQISTSWGGSEIGLATALGTQENASFAQMAMQGQSIYAASGDNGTYPVSSSTAAEVQDPAVESNMCGVGGTTLFVQSPGTNEAYKSETVWNNFLQGFSGAGGGGVSTLFTIPSYQSGPAAATLAGSPSSGVSTTMRNVPDVSLDADPQTGYLIYVSDPTNGPGYIQEGGTSAAAPLWAGFTALINQNYARNNVKNAGGQVVTFGSANAMLYPYAPGGALYNAATYNAVFHDITVGNNSHSGSATGLYPAVPGYDCATGIGTFNGLPLIRLLTGATPSAITISPSPISPVRPGPVSAAE